VDVLMRSHVAGIGAHEHRDVVAIAVFLKAFD
jgi:hypothetical protein